MRPKQPIVQCRNCKHHTLHTEGSSYNNDTHEWFLCHCAKGHDKDRFGYTSLLFVNNDRTCEDFKQQ